LLLALGLVLSAPVAAQDPSPERQLILDAAEALGGLERVQSVRTLRLLGYGH
jgi:hypothetical protein